MNINTSRPITGLQTTDGGYKYRRVQTVKVGSSNQTGLLEIESKFSTDGKGVGRLLVKVDLPYFTVNTAACCCDDSGNSAPTYAQAGKISFHTVLTLPKAAIGDIKSPNAALAANQIASVIGLCLAVSNTYRGGDSIENILAPLDEAGALLVSTTDDVHGILDPTRSIIRGVMGVTPFPAEGFTANEVVRLLN